VEQEQTKNFTSGPIQSFSMPILLDRGTGAMLIAPVGSIGKKIEMAAHFRLLFADTDV